MLVDWRPFVFSTGEQLFEEIELLNLSIPSQHPRGRQNCHGHRQALKENDPLPSNLCSLIAGGTMSFEVLPISFF